GRDGEDPPGQAVSQAAGHQPGAAGDPGARAARLSPPGCGRPQGQRTAAVPGAARGGCASADEHETLLLHAPDVITDRIDVALVVTGQQDGPSLLPQLLQQDTDPMDAGLIKAVEGCVQQEQTPSCHQCLGDGESLSHAALVVADLLRGCRGQTDSLHRSRGVTFGDQASECSSIAFWTGTTAQTPSRSH